MLDDQLTERIKKLLSQYRVMLFMKGTPEMPQCGFSSSAVALLIESSIYFESFDVYSDEDIRQGIKEYSSWPTYPQLYIDGELVGGIDILAKMYENGELESLKKEKNL